jgi:SAM-dependent methyltransferase
MPIIKKSLSITKSKEQCSFPSIYNNLFTYQYSRQIGAINPIANFNFPVAKESKITVFTVMKPDRRPYNRFARLYDLMEADKFSKKMVDYTYRLLGRFRRRPKSILELCCGTGTAAAMFASQGFEVTGLDGSPEMIKAARAKAKKLKLPIKFFYQRLPNFKIIKNKKGDYRSFDLVTCFYDSLNYILKKEDLKKTFAAVNHHLNDDGLFIFDMNTRHALQTLWGDKVYAGSHSGMAWIWQSIYYNKAAIADLRTIFFIKQGKQWDMFDEIHSEKAYPNSTIKSLLNQTGFEILGFYGCFRFRRPPHTSNRIAVVARKVKRL